MNKLTPRQIVQVLNPLSPAGGDYPVQEARREIEKRLYKLVEAGDNPQKALLKAREEWLAKAMGLVPVGAAAADEDSPGFPTL